MPKNEISTLWTQLEPSLRAYDRVVSLFGFEPVKKAGVIDILGWKLEYVCGPALASFIDQILVRRLNDFTTDIDQPVILDCGANIGFGILNYRRQFPKSKIIAFEPDPQFAPVLRRNLCNNGASDVVVVEAAAWIRSGKVNWLCEGVDGSKIVESDQGQPNLTVVSAVDLADYLRGPVDLLKLDIEGAEYRVVGHLGERLKQAKNILIECHIDQSNVLDFSRMLEVLATAGFKININSFGTWRDLIRQPAVPTNHWEQYLIVAARQGTALPPSDENELMPYIGAKMAVEMWKLRQESERLIEREAGRSQVVSLLIENRATQSTSLQRPFKSDGGRCWYASLPSLRSYADNDNQPTRSTVLLLEDEKLLGPAHCYHEDIRQIGGGKYSHWKSKIFFSTSDNIDPNINGRSYRVSVIRPA
jgi:FkbM family methyltransferase